MNKRLIVLIVISIIGITSCKQLKADGKLSAMEEVNIAKKCLTLLNKNGRIGYVVSPRFQNFEFNSFLRENTKGHNYDVMKSEILDSLNWTNEEFIETQKKVNIEYLSKSNPEFLKLSTSKISNEVIIFSGISKNLVFANIVTYCNAVKVSDLSSSSFNKKKRFPSAVCYIFLIKDENVEMIKDSHIVKEYQCDSTDVFVDENGIVIKQEE